jgi:hypothetical protein
MNASDAAANRTNATKDVLYDTTLVLIGTVTETAFLKGLTVVTGHFNNVTVLEMSHPYSLLS